MPASRVANTVAAAKVFFEKASSNYIGVNFSSSAVSETCELLLFG